MVKQAVAFIRTRRAGRYLEKNGVVSQLTRVLVGLYEEPERPTNAVDYIKKSACWTAREPHT